MGDLFLFFGSFKRTYESEGQLHFERDYERHIMFGYLYVDEIVLPYENPVPKTFNYHPHVVHQKEYGKLNTLYIAHGQDRFGVFPYDKQLVLTRSGFSKSQWELPVCFHPSQGTVISRHSEKDFAVEKWEGIVEIAGNRAGFCGEGE